MPMLYDVIKSVHIVAIVVWFGGTMSAVLALAYANPNHCQVCPFRSSRYDGCPLSRLVSRHHNGSLVWLVQQRLARHEARVCDRSFRVPRYDLQALHGGSQKQTLSSTSSERAQFKTHSALCTGDGRGLLDDYWAGNNDG